MKNQSNMVVTIGELLIDFLCTDINVSLVEGNHYVKEAGGAPANVAAAISKLGGYAAFIGKVGNDAFGEFLKKSMENQEVDTTMLVKDTMAPTTLAFVSRKVDGERDFNFNRGADALLTYNELDLEKIKSAKVIHFGSATALLEGLLRETYFKVMEVAKENEIYISFDPNYRSDLWKGRLEEFIILSKRAISNSDFVKVSEEELALITQSSNQSESVRVLHELGAKVVTVTLGNRGTLLSNGKEEVIIESINIKSVDSTGAGDAFVGAMLSQIAELDYPKRVVRDLERLEKMTSFANKVGAIVCTQVGAISALPSYDEVIQITHRLK